METIRSKIEDIKIYYGRVLKSKADLKTSACCVGDSLPDEIRAILQEIEPEILERFYGCGSPIPKLLQGCTVLDLGCGTGRDVYIVSRLVGGEGRVIGVDMTDEQLETARRHLPRQMERFGYHRPNVEFRQAYIEDLRAAGIPDGSVDVVVSNCVINLSPDKERVFREIFRVLKPGGELFFADIFADARLPQAFRDDPLACGECLGGAMYIEDFRRMLARLGCPDHRVVSRRPVAVEDPGLAAKAGPVTFFSMTVRAFRLEGLEDRCEDYGQVAYYAGTIPGCPNAFRFDDHHLFETGRPVLVCGNTAAMLTGTRYRDHFRVTGDRSRHFGLFPCSTSGERVSDDGGGCC